MKPDIRILYRFEMKGTVRLPIEDEPTERMHVVAIAEDFDDALKICRYLAKKRGKIVRHGKPNMTEIAIAYYPHLPGCPECTKEEIEELYKDMHKLPW